MNLHEMMEHASLVEDREDLIALLRMRFGDISVRMMERIYEINRLDMLQRLILVAANVDEYERFEEELNAGDEAYKLVGELFQPGSGGVGFA